MDSENEQSYVLKIPYISEVMTRKVKRALRTHGVNARVVTTPGTSVRNMIMKTHGQQITDCKCKLCTNNIDCTTRHFVYKAKCLICWKSYIGASYRPAADRIKEHESSIRLQNDKSALTKHFLQDHHDLLPSPLSQLLNNHHKGSRDMDTFFKNFDFSIIKRCRDTLDTFINEGIEIRDERPEINGKDGNGFVDLT